MKVFSSLICLLFCSLVATAQLKNTQVAVYFESNSFTLTEPEKNRLDSLADLLTGAVEFSVELSAHTDLQGEEYYNMILSQKREKAVFDYLATRGVNPEFIVGSHHGEEEPVLADVVTEDVPQNRRVEIHVSYWYLSDAESVLEYAGMESEQRFSFEGNGSQEVQGEKGTVLNIPADAFQTKGGEPVSNAEVEFVLEEFPGLGAAVTHQLSTVSGGQILESGGMFRMEAYYKGEQLELREGKEINVQLPSDNLQPGMTVFVGQRNENGVVEWEDTKEEFKVEDTTVKPKLPLPGYAEYLRSLRVPVTLPSQYTVMVFDRPVPVSPRVPRMPKKPAEPKAPQQPEGNDSRWTGMFDKEWRQYNKQMRVYRKDYEVYTRRMEQYEKRMERYTSHYAQYLLDSAKYVKDIREWNEMLAAIKEERIQLYEDYKATYDGYRLNRALNGMARKIDDSSFYNSNILSLLSRTSGSIVEDQYYATLANIHMDLKLIEVLQSENFPRYRRYVTYKGNVSYTAFLRSDKMKRFAKENFTYFKAIKNIGANAYREAWDTTTVAKLEAMGEKMQEEKNRLGIFDRSDIGNMYQANIRGLGYINCDRFVGSDPNKMAGLNVNAPAGSKIFVVIPSMNSVLPLYSGHDSTAVVRLPIGEEIKVVTVGVYNGKPTYDVQVLKVQPVTNKVKMQPRLVSIQTLKEQLGRL